MFRLFRPNIIPRRVPLGLTQLKKPNQLHKVPQHFNKPIPNPTNPIPKPIKTVPVPTTIPQHPNTEPDHKLDRLEKWVLIMEKVRIVLMVMMCVPLSLIVAMGFHANNPDACIVACVGLLFLMII